jgi:hypothetical protein
MGKWRKYAEEGGFQMNERKWRMEHGMEVRGGRRSDNDK